MYNKMQKHRIGGKKDSTQCSLSIYLLLCPVPCREAHFGLVYTNNNVDDASDDVDGDNNVDMLCS